jgi:peptide deformylase
MAILPVLRYPDPRLRQPTRDVVEITAETRALVRDMTDTMYGKDGAGLAAIQVDSSLRIYIVEARVAGGPEGSPAVVCINPELLWLSPETEVADEGCLSFPGVFVPIKRALRARVRALDLDGKSFEAEGEGLYARAMQHEIDHLMGRLLIDRVGPVKRQMIKRQLRRDAEEEDAAASGSAADRPGDLTGDPPPVAGAGAGDADSEPPVPSAVAASGGARRPKL